MLQNLDSTPVIISAPAKEKLEILVGDAKEKGASVYTAPSPPLSSDPPLLQSHYYYPATVVTGLTKDMTLYEFESFGPILCILTVENEDAMMDVIQESKYGLSSSIISKDHYRALELARSISAGAVHINSMTVHDEPTLPHGGHGESGWGRFGAQWGLEEFADKSHHHTPRDGTETWISIRDAGIPSEPGI
jgi:acyl-CoA reductase-like NAD-dependent aldehyde dehydrogenase